MEDSSSAPIGDSFDSSHSSSSSEEDDFTLGNDNEACEFLQAMDAVQEKKDTNYVTSPVVTSKDTDAFEFCDDEIEFDAVCQNVKDSITSGEADRCCDRFCLSKGLTKLVKTKIDDIVMHKNTCEIKQTLLNQLYTQQDLGIPTHVFCFGGQIFCHKAFSNVSQVSIYLVREVFKAFSVGQKYFIHGNVVGLNETAATIRFICWVKQFAEQFGNFAPDEKVIVISACFTVKEIYELYKLKAPQPQVAKSSFYNLFKSKFGVKRVDKSLPCIRISSYSTHSRCDQCLLLEKFQRSCQTENDLAMAKSLKQEHKQTYVRARIAIEEKRLQALNDPASHVFIQIDDMDNHKSYLPHPREMGKDTSSIVKLASKITGTIVWSSHYPQGRKIQCFVNHDQYEQGSSKLVSILYRLIQSMSQDFGDLPTHCHLNLDNCWRENKNMFLFSFLSALVELGVFVDITVDFMLVGHTGNQVDQIFSILTTEFKSEIMSPDDLLDKIRNSAIIPSPLCEELFFIWNWRDFVKPNMTENKLKNHSFFHSFLVKKENSVGVLRAKKYPQDTQWRPDDGIKLLKDKVDFSKVEVADLRIEKLILDQVFHGLYTKYFPQLAEHDRKKSEASWERLRTTLENLPKKKSNFPQMKLLELPKQTVKINPIIPCYLETFQTPELRELVGSKHLLEPESSIFRTEVRVEMDVAVYTHTKSTRPWLGRVLKVLPGGKDFEIHWFKRRSKNLLFYSVANSDKSPFTSIMSTDSVMLWNFSDNKTENAFELSHEWFTKIMKEYSDHDKCYELD